MDNARVIRWILNCTGTYRPVSAVATSSEFKHRKESSKRNEETVESPALRVPKHRIKLKRNTRVRY